MNIEFDLMEPAAYDLREKAEQVCSAFMANKDEFSAWNVTQILREHFPTVNIKHDLIRQFVHNFMTDDMQSDTYDGSIEKRDGNVFTMYREIVKPVPAKSTLKFSVKVPATVTLASVNPVEQFGQVPIRNVFIGGVMYTMYNPYSSAFKEVGWNAADNSMLVVFNSGHAYVISNFGRAAWTAFKESTSRGTYYHEKIKGNIFYPSREVVVF